MSPDRPPLAWDEFERVDIRAGTILHAEPTPGARKSAYRLQVDFGPELGVRTSSAQLTAHYQPPELVGRQVLAVVNFPPRQIAQTMSQVLVLGLPDASGAIVLVQPERPVPNGARMC